MAMAEGTADGSGTPLGPQERRRDGLPHGTGGYRVSAQRERERGRKREREKQDGKAAGPGGWGRHMHR